jgi:charged multivesicular body protein 7
MDSPSSVYQSSSLPCRAAKYVIGKPLWWALEQMNIVASDEQLSENDLWKRVSGDYVLLSAVEAKAELVLEKQRSKPALNIADNLYDIQLFKREFFASESISDLDCRVLLRFLQRDKSAIDMEENVRLGRAS